MERTAEEDTLPLIMSLWFQRPVVKDGEIKGQNMVLTVRINEGVAGMPDLREWAAHKFAATIGLFRVHGLPEDHPPLKEAFVQPMAEIYAPYGWPSVIDKAFAESVLREPEMVEALASLGYSAAA